MKNIIKTINPELLIWIVSLLFLALYPFSTNEISLCLFDNLGLPYCPGCGLGMSIHHLFHLDLYNSFAAHPLGIIALPVITFRIITLTRTCLTHYYFLNRRNYNA